MRNTYGIHGSCAMQNAQYAKSIRGYTVETLQYTQLQILNACAGRQITSDSNNLNAGDGQWENPSKSHENKSVAIFQNLLKQHTCQDRCYLPPHTVPEKLIRKVEE